MYGHHVLDCTVCDSAMYRHHVLHIVYQTVTSVYSQLALCWFSELSAHTTCTFVSTI